MELDDEYLLALPDNGTVPDDQIISVEMKMGTLRQIKSFKTSLTNDIISDQSDLAITVTIKPGQIWVCTGYAVSHSHVPGDRIKILHIASGYKKLRWKFMNYPDDGWSGYFKEITINRNFKYVAD